MKLGFCKGGWRSGRRGRIALLGAWALALGGVSGDASPESMKETPLQRRAASRLQKSVASRIGKPIKMDSHNSRVRWIRPSKESPATKWGIEGGVQFSLWPAAIGGEGEGGPRGLVRVGFPVLDGGSRAGLVNFIAVEPEVSGHPKGYSELETSSADGRPGKPMWASAAPGSPPEAGVISRPDPNDPELEELTVTVRMERFANGAHPYLKLSIRSDRPGELRLRAYHEPGSAPMERCILTATMGNFARLRRLHLKDGVVDARELFKAYDGDHFTEDALFPLHRLAKNRRGDVVAALTTDEAEPERVQPFPHDPVVWRWRGAPVTQYWRKGAGAYGPDLQVRVNARRVYWRSRQPIPGGISYENAELRERYRPGALQIFGITRRSPEELLR